MKSELLYCRSGHSAGHSLQPFAATSRSCRTYQSSHEEKPPWKLRGVLQHPQHSPWIRACICVCCWLLAVRATGTVTVVAKSGPPDRLARATRDAGTSASPTHGKTHVRRRCGCTTRLKHTVTGLFLVQRKNEVHSCSYILCVRFFITERRYYNSSPSSASPIHSNTYSIFLILTDFFKSCINTVFCLACDKM